GCTVAVGFAVAVPAAGVPVADVSANLEPAAAVAVAVVRVPVAAPVTDVPVASAAGVAPLAGPVAVELASGVAVSEETPSVVGGTAALTSALGSLRAPRVSYARTIAKYVRPGTAPV